MRTGWSALAAVAFGVSTIMASFAADTGRTATMEQNIAKAMQSEINTRMFWQPLGDGAVREKRSGLVCAGELSPDMPLDFLSGPVPADAMSVVGCIYRSADRSNVVHIVMSPNPFGTEFMRKMLPIMVLQLEKGTVSLGAKPIPGVADGEEEAAVADKDGKKQFHYWVSAPAGRFFIVVHTIAPNPETVDRDAARKTPVALLIAALTNITAFKH